MADLHWTAATDRLAALAQTARLGLFADFDGTLSPLTPYPAIPDLSPRNRELLIAFAARLPIVSVISGRGAADVRDYVRLPTVRYVGNHGLEYLRGDDLVVVEAAKEWEAKLSGFLHDLEQFPVPPGARYQPKRITMSIMYRATANPVEARQHIRAMLERINGPYGFSFSEGHTIWEVKPPIAFDKGTAIAALIDEFTLDGAIFLGDDITDISGLETVCRYRDTGHLRQGLAVAVNGERDLPEVRAAADVVASSVTDVEALLGWLYDHLPPLPTTQP